MFSLAAGSRSADEPIRTQRDRSTTRDSPIRTHRSTHVKESDSSNNYPVIVGPLTTNQDLRNVNGEKIYNLPLMIQQPFLREKKEPIKVDISVKLIPKPRKKDKKRREARVEEIPSPDSNKGVVNSINLEVTDKNIQVIRENVEVIKDKANDESKRRDSSTIECQKVNENVGTVTETVDPDDSEKAKMNDDIITDDERPSKCSDSKLDDDLKLNVTVEEESDSQQELDDTKHDTKNN